MADRGHHIVQAVKVAVVIMNVASRDDAKLYAFPHVDQRACHGQIPSNAVPLDLHIKPVSSEHLSKLLTDVINGTVQLSALLERKFKSVVFKGKKGLSVPTTIHFDQEFSKRCTIMEIVAQDAFGLLYRIASAISAHDCNIEVALIATEGHRAIDVFYITKQGAKLSPELKSQIEGNLTEAFAPKS